MQDITRIRVFFAYMGKYGREKTRSGILGSAFAPRDDICDIMLIKERVYLSFVMSCIQISSRNSHSKITVNIQSFF